MQSRANRARRLAVPALLLAPAFIFVIGVSAYPLGLAVWLSFTDAQVGEPGHFIGLGNYAYLLEQGTYADALRNTAVYTGLSTLIKAGLGLGMALALARSFPGRRLVYALLFLPLVFPVVIGTVAWYYLFSNVHGAINYLLLETHLVADSIAWLGLGPLPMASLVTVNVWHGTALFGVLLLAALRSVPAEVLDAAAIDGARPLRRFQHVVLPYLGSALALGTVLSVVGTFGDFAIVHLLTGGGPANETTIVSTMAFQIALRDGALGVGTAVALSIIPVYLAVLVYVVRVAGRR
ncbi:MAG TPA: sugar ABC transporter permease [Candidatus Acidoferrales bacterium]|nr:sugar ABC transporter permease [Candidatus Acidoferrales bacterium]